MTRSFDVFFGLHLNKRLNNNRDVVDLRRHRAHYDVIVMETVGRKFYSTYSPTINPSVARVRVPNWPNFRNPRTHLFHIPQRSIQNKNVHISVTHGALWDMEEVHSGICKNVLFEDSRRGFRHCALWSGWIYWQLWSINKIDDTLDLG